MRYKIFRKFLPNTLSVGFCLLLVTSCTSETGSQTGPEFSDMVLVKGLYLRKGTLDSLRDCADDRRSYFIIDQTNSLATRYMDMQAAKSGDAVLTELKGLLKKAVSDTGSSVRPDTLTIVEILRLERKDAQNTCLPYDFRAMGNFPDWDLQISPSEDLILFSDMKAKRFYRFKYVKPKLNKDSTQYTYQVSNRADRSSGRFIIQKKTCSKTFSSESFDFSATAIINGQTFEGCAVSGD